MGCYYPFLYLSSSTLYQLFSILPVHQDPCIAFLKCWKEEHTTNMENNLDLKGMLGEKADFRVTYCIIISIYTDIQDIERI